MSRSSAPPSINTVQRLHYTAAADLASGLAIPATTWVDIGTNQSFVVASTTSLISIHVSGVVLANTGASFAAIASRILVNSGSTPIARALGGDTLTAGTFVNFLNGAGTILLTGLSSGTHTLKLQVYASIAIQAFCRAATQAPLESLQFYVAEHF